jgi:ubiquinone/menaquinone biosynthesis C-methylase UbiE
VKAGKTTERMRQTWDAAARTENPLYVGLSEPAETQLERMLALVGASHGGTGTCLEIGCGDGRMTVSLATRWDDVLAVDVSPEMLRRAADRSLPNVTFRLVSGVALDGVADASADQVICYGVLQHLPTKQLIGAYLAEFARVLRPSGEAIAHLPVISGDVASRIWRRGRRVAIAVRSSRTDDFSSGISYMGARVTERELAAIVRRSGLRVAARTELESYFVRARNVVLRLRF